MRYIISIIFLIILNYGPNSYASLHSSNIFYIAYQNSLRGLVNGTVNSKHIAEDKSTIFEFYVKRSGLLKVQIVENMITLYVDGGDDPDGALLKIRSFAACHFSCKQCYKFVNRYDREHEQKHANYSELDMSHFHLLHLKKRKIHTEDMKYLIKGLVKENFIDEAESITFMKYFRDFQSKTSDLEPCVIS